MEASLETTMNILSFVLTTLFVTPQIAAPADMASFDAKALVKPSLIKLSSETGKTHLAGVAAVLDQQLSRIDRRYLGNKVLSKRRVSIAKGSFPKGADKLVTVNVDLRKKKEEDPQKYISGVFTMSASGELVDTIVQLRTRTERFELQALGDVDGDALTDAVVVKANDTDSTTHLFAWTGGASVDHDVTAPSDRS